MNYSPRNFYYVTNKEVLCLIVKFLAAALLDAGAAGFAVQPPLACAFTGAGGHTVGLFMRSLPDEFGQTLSGVLPVLLLGAVIAGGDDNHSVSRGATASQRKQTRADPLGQGWRVGSIKPQLRSGGDLVHILAAGAGRQNVGKGEFRVIQSKGGGDGNLHPTFLVVLGESVRSAC